AGRGISNENVFIKAQVSKTSVYEQEPLLVTYKLYTLLDVVQCNNRKMPDFKGFMKNEIELSQNKQFSYENFNGKNYGTVVLYQVLLFPQQAGELKIDKA
ncbi:BatD family protein, partial [bacterium]|nr:BatD family protein [bacterium]